MATRHNSRFSDALVQGDQAPQPRGKDLPEHTGVPQASDGVVRGTKPGYPLGGG